MAFQNAPRRGFGGHRINLPRNFQQAPAGTGGSMPGPAQQSGGSYGGINWSQSGSGMQGAPRVGNRQPGFNYNYNQPGQPQIPAGVSTAQSPGMQQAAPMAFRKGGAVRGYEDGGAIEDDSEMPDTSPSTDMEDGEKQQVASTGIDALEDANTDDTTRNINAALAKVGNVFDGVRQAFGLDMNNAVSGTRRFVGAGVLGSAPLRAGDDAWRKFHGDDEPTGLKEGGPVERKGYDDGGAIEDDTTGSVDEQADYSPPIDDTGGAGQVPRLAAYVQGEGAAPADEVQRYLSQYDHLPREQAVVQGLADATDQPEVPGVGAEGVPSYGGMDATSLLQGYRQHYDHGRAYAYAAANGNAQKPANLQDSVKAANDAFPYVPDGERVHFSVGPNNTVAVAIGGPNGEQRANTTLTVDQYKALLTQADFDSVYERTPSLMIANVLNQNMQQAGVTTGPQQAQQQPQGGEFMAGSVQPSAGPAPQQQAPQQAQRGQVIQGRTDDQGNPLTPDHHPGYNMYQNARGTYYVPQDLDARSQALTGGWLSREQERQQWLNEQMQQGIKNEIDFTKARNPLGVQQLRNEGAITRTKYASDLKANWEDNRTRAQIMINLDRIAAQHENEQARNAARISSSLLLGGADPTEVPDLVKKYTGMDMSNVLRLGGNTPQAPNAANSRPQAPSPRQGQNTQVQAPQAPQTVFKDGKLWYKTQRGTWSDTPQ